MDIILKNDNDFLADLKNIKDIYEFDLFLSYVWEFLKKFTLEYKNLIQIKYIILNIVLKFKSWQIKNITFNIKTFIYYIIEKKIISDDDIIYFNDFLKNYNCVQKFIINPGIKSKYFDEFKINKLLSKLTGEEIKNNINIGNCILNLNGDFIYSDSCNNKFFDIKFSKKKMNNFMDNMIPISKFLINKKISKLKKAKTFIFKYFVYSRFALFKNLKLKKQELIESGTKKIPNLNNNNNLEIYYKFLLCLSSRLTCVQLQNYNLDKIKNFAEIPDNRVVIWMETRYSKDIPNYDFTNWLDNPLILSMEEEYNKKLKKFFDKNNFSK